MRLVILWLAVTLMPLATFGQDAKSEAARPNVVLIMLDDMGYGDPGCFNPQSKIRTPNFDAIATAGMRFTDAHAPGPLCHLSRYGLLTGRYPFRAETGRWPKHAVIQPDQTTLASMLKRRGYATAMVGKWHLGFEENGYDQALPGGPVDVGFDSFFGIRASTDIPPYFYIRGNRAVMLPTVSLAANNSEGWSPIQGKFWREGLIAEDMNLQNVLPKFTDEAIAVIEQHASARTASAQDSASGDRSGVNRAGGDAKPLFLYLAYPAPHTPWLPDEEFAGKSDVGLYGDFAEMVDAMLGRVLRSLDDCGLSENTLLIVTSDNGPCWYEEDTKRFGHDSSGNWRGMKSDAWEAGHRMPFAVRWPGVVQPGSVSDQPICFTDIMATLATITETELGETEGPDSFDFSSILVGTHTDTKPLRRSLPIRSGGGFRTIRVANWKLIDGLGSGGFSDPKKIRPTGNEPTVQLYDLSQDPGETTNMAAQKSDVVEQLMRTLQSIEQASSHRLMDF